MKKVVMMVRFTVEVPDSFNEEHMFLSFDSLDVVKFSVPEARLLDLTTIDIQEYDSESDGLPSKTF